MRNPPNILFEGEISPLPDQEPYVTESTTDDNQEEDHLGNFTVEAVKTDRKAYFQEPLRPEGFCGHLAASGKSQTWRSSAGITFVLGSGDEAGCTGLLLAQTVMWVLFCWSDSFTRVFGEDRPCGQFDTKSRPRMEGWHAGQ